MFGGIGARAMSEKGKGKGKGKDESVVDLVGDLWRLQLQQLRQLQEQQQQLEQQDAGAARVLLQRWRRDSDAYWEWLLDMYGTF